MCQENKKLLSVSGLSVKYLSDDGDVYAVNGIDLELDKGETLGLVGETGAGQNHDGPLHPAASAQGYGQDHRRDDRI